MNFYKQKLRFLMAEQTKKLGQARLQHLKKMKRLQDEIWEVEMSVKEALIEKKKELRRAQVSIFETIRSMHLEHSQSISKCRSQFSNEIRRIEMSTERSIEGNREMLEAESKDVATSIKLHKDEQIAYMTHMHEKQLLEMKTFFNELSVNNLAVITSLQAEVETKKENEQSINTRLKQIEEKYNKLKKPAEENEGKLVLYQNEERGATLTRQALEKAAKQVKITES